MFTCAYSGRIVDSSTSGKMCMGDTYTISADNNCESVSQATSMATDRLITENGLDYQCTTLKVGNQLCIQDTCLLSEIRVNETCNGIFESHGISLVNLVLWNPTIHNNCDNVGSMSGRSICFS